MVSAASGSRISILNLNVYDFVAETVKKVRQQEPGQKEKDVKNFDSKLGKSDQLTAKQKFEDQGQSIDP